jgi:hypothetical protein
MLVDTVEMGENQMGPKVLGRYCKMGGNRNFKKLVGTLKGE